MSNEKLACRQQALANAYYNQSVVSRLLGQLDESVTCQKISALYYESARRLMGAK